MRIVMGFLLIWCGMPKMLFEKLVLSFVFNAMLLLVLPGQLIALESRHQGRWRRCPFWRDSLLPLVLMCLTMLLAHKF